MKLNITNPNEAIGFSHVFKLNHHT